MNIACKMKVDIFHRNNLSISAATGTALYTKAGTKTRLTKGNNSFLSYAVETICKSNAYGRFSLSGRSRGNGCYKNQLARLAGSLFLQGAKFFKSNFCLVRAVVFKLVCRDSNFSGNFSHRNHLIFLSDFDICH